MLVKVITIPPNKDYIVIRQQDGQVNKFPRRFARHVSANDICVLTQYRNRPQLKLLTDDDEVVMMNHPNRKRMVPYGYFGPATKTPEPILTP